MTEDETDSDYVDYVGVVLGKNSNGKYDCYRVSIVEGSVSFVPIKFGSDRLKKSALKQMALDLVGISQALTRGDIEFVSDVS